MSGLLELSPEIYEQMKGNLETIQQAVTSGIEQLSLTKPRQEHDSWIQAVNKAAQMIEEDHNHLVNEENKIAAEKAEIMALIAEGRQEKEVVLQNINEKRAQISLLNAEFNSKREELAESQRALDLKKSKNQQKMQHLSKALVFFQNSMDLEVRKIKGGNLQFVFRNINPSDPSQPCTFTIHLLPEGGFEVMDCQPPISCMPELLDRLRETKAMNVFFARLRKAFQATF